MVVFGIDPGYALTGYGVVEYKGNRFRVIDFGVVSTKPGVPMDRRLLQISEELEQLIAAAKPDAVAIEELFFSRNVTTAIAAAQGRGVAIVTAARAGIPVYEYTPMQVKQAVSGYGRADKKQVQEMVRILLALDAIPKPDDAADALAIAICHAHAGTGWTSGRMV